MPQIMPPNRFGIERTTTIVYQSDIGIETINLKEEHEKFQPDWISFYSFASELY